MAGKRGTKFNFGGWQKFNWRGGHLNKDMIDKKGFQQLEAAEQGLKAEKTA